MTQRAARRRCLPVAVLLVASAVAGAEGIPVEMGGYRGDSGVTIVRVGETIRADWPIGDGAAGRVVIDLRAGRPLVEGIGIVRDGAYVNLGQGLDPAYVLTVGTRVGSPGRPAGMSPFNTFFDSPAKRPHRSHRATVAPTRARVESRPGRATIRVDGLVAGPFAGGIEFTIYAGTGLVQVEAVVSTREELCAYFYDAGLTGVAPGWDWVAWTDARGEARSAGVGAADRSEAVRYRTIVAESRGGSVAVFPPPHAYFSPRDFTDNLANAWHGRGHRGLDDRPGVGIRQAETGGGNYSPWINAPAGSEQRLGVFLLLTPGGADRATAEALRYTRGDRFPDLAGHVTFATHWHMAIAVAAMKEVARGGPRSTPDFVKMFKDMNVGIVHLAEFHGDGHPRDPGPLRLPELDAMFAECRRLSDDRLLFLPGEEANVHFDAVAKGSEPGHWIYLFPRPVRWIMRRSAGEPFEEARPGGGSIYRVGDRAEMLRLIERGNGLAWTAHARIKASNWAPDGYRDEAFFRSPRWLGAAWKAMPSDLSEPRLGRRTLDLLDDMANWGARKQLLGEVDVFTLDRTHELYGHMNINYVKLDPIPRFDDDWTPLLEALRAGRFFVTTGEVILRDLRLGGKSTGETVALPADGRPELTIDLEWTFPLRFAEVISGDGRSVHRERIDLSDTGAFGARTIRVRPDLRGRTWARVEVWDVATNGAFGQPFWLAGGQR